jgi:hypothetical protein
MVYNKISSEGIDLKDQPSNSSQLELPQYPAPTTPARIGRTEEYILAVARACHFTSADIQLLAARKDCQVAKEQKKAKFDWGNFFLCGILGMIGILLVVLLTVVVAMGSPNWSVK